MNDSPLSGITSGGHDSDFELMVNSIPQLAWMAKPDGWIFWYNRRWFDYTGTTIDEMQGWGWRAVHHPDHVDRVVENFTQSFSAGEPWEDLFPLRNAAGEYRWFLSRAMPIRNDDGQIVRWFGTNTDVTEQKRNEERQTLLMREVDHRAKNALAVALAIVRLSKASSTESFKDVVEGRISALARVHGLLADSNWYGADLEQLLRDEVSIFHEPGLIALSLRGPSVSLPPDAAQSLVLIVHELATNAQKFGALSAIGETLDIEWQRIGDHLNLTWRETTRDTISSPAADGFGSTLLEMLVNEFEGGSVEREWRDKGLTVRISGSLDQPPSRTPAAAIDRAADPVVERTDAVRSILIVEDEILTALDLTQRCESAGYRVIGPAGTMDQARAAVDAEQPDLALLDCNVRGERSWDLAEQLVADGIPVIFCTGYERLEGLPDALKPCPTITKPFNENELFAAIRTGLVES